MRAEPAAAEPGEVERLMLQEARDEVISGSAVWPRYTSVDVNDGVHYWGHAARFTTLAALTETLDTQPIDPVARTRHQFWRMSHVVARKFRRLRLAMGFAVAGAILALASTVSG